MNCADYRRDTTAVATASFAARKLDTDVDRFSPTKRPAGRCPLAIALSLSFAAQIELVLVVAWP